jgi:hypothetical protein
MALFSIFRSGTWFRCADGNIRIASFFLETTAEIVVVAVYGTSSAGASYKIVPVCRFNFVAADVAADRIFDDHLLTSFNNFLINCAPYCTPSIKALRS